MDLRAAEVFLGLLVVGRTLVGFTQPVDHGGPGSEDLAEALDHDRVMAGDRACRAEPGSRAERKGDDRHRVEVLHHVRPAGDGRDIGRADLFERLHAAAAAGAVDHADDRQLQFVRHLLGLHHLAADACVGRPAANGEIVGRGHDRAAVHQRLAEQEGGGKDAGEIAVLVIRTASCDLADFAESTIVAQRGEPGACVHLAAPMLAGDLIRAAHLFGQRLAVAQFFQFLVPAHARALSSGKARLQGTGRKESPILLQAPQPPARPRPAPGCRR